MRSRLTFDFSVEGLFKPVYADILFHRGESIMRTAAAGLVLVALSGCTSLSVTQPGNPVPSATRLPAGLIYHTPAALITASIAVTIKDCPADEKALAALHGYARSAPPPIKEVEFSVSGDLTTEIVPDRPIMIDYRKLATFLKTSSVAIERYPSGTLKSVNASIEDQSAEALGDVVAVAGSVALLATGAAPAAGLVAAPLVAAGDGDRSMNGPGRGKPRAVTVPTSTVYFAACNADTLKAISDRKNVSGKRDDDTRLLNKATADLNALNGTPGGSDAAAAKIVANLKAKVTQLSAQIDDETAQIASANSKLSLPLDIGTVDEPTDHTPATDGQGHLVPSTLRHNVVFTADPARLRQFVGQHFVDASGRIATTLADRFRRRPCLNGGGSPADETCSSAGQIAKVLADKVGRVFAIGAPIRPVADPHGNQPSAEALSPKFRHGVNAAEVPASEGIIYIEPEKFRVQLSAAAIGPESASHPRKPLKTVDLSVPQLGRYLSLPLRAGFGEKVTLVATFAEDGTLLTATYANPKTAGKSLSGALKGAADAAVSTSNAIEDRRVKLAKDRADILAAQASAADSVKKLNPTVDPLADVNAELAKANAQAALAEALVRIKAANATLGVTP